MSISGVRYQVDLAHGASLCIIDNLSEDLKNLIRSELSKVCHGTAKSSSAKSIYSYVRTLSEFMKRYKGKTSPTKLGMIGELLCHILLFSHDQALSAVSPMFNMEEASIKKGFDLLATRKSDSTLWITEVKSGELGKVARDQKTRILIDKARDDLVHRIGAENATIWHTAINNVSIAVESNRPEKTVLLELLEDLLDNSEKGANDPSLANVILVPILFENTTNAMNFEIIKEKNKILIEANTFASCIIFAIQKSTLDKVEKFLYSEIGESP